MLRLFASVAVLPATQSPAVAEACIFPVELPAFLSWPVLFLPRLRHPCPGVLFVCCLSPEANQAEPRQPNIRFRLACQYHVHPLQFPVGAVPQTPAAALFPHASSLLLQLHL